MLKLGYIKKLQGYKFFDDYDSSKFDEIKPFAQYNLVYGFNGCGKSTLAEFFYLLGENALDEPKPKFLFKFYEIHNGKETSTDITEKRNLEILPNFKVFHCDYVKETVANKDLKYIYTLGKEHGDSVLRLEDAKKELEELEPKIADLAIKTKEHENNLDKFGQETAKKIKDNIGNNSSYNKTNYFKDIVINVPCLLSAEDLSNYKTQLKSDILPEISFLIPQIKQAPSFDEIKSLLSQSPSNIAIEKFTKNSKLNSWAETGLKIHEENDSSTCHFCDNTIDPGHLRKLKAHFDDSYTNLQSELTSNIDKIKSTADSLKVVASSPAIFNETVYKDLNEEYLQAQKNIKSKLDSNIVALEKMEKILLNKKENITKSFDDFEQELQSAFEHLELNNSIFQEIQSVIKKHNEKTNNFGSIIKTARDKITSHFLSESKTEYEKKTTLIKEQQDALDGLRKVKKSLENDIDSHESAIKDFLSTQNKINLDIAEFFGRQEIELKANDGCYEVLRDGKRIDRLSTGEENALALIYFFNSLDDKDLNRDNTIVVLDDPVSSFDSSFYYHAVAYIYEKTKDFKQVFIFTHKFSAYSDFKKTYSKARGYILKRKGNSPFLTNSSHFLDNHNGQYAFLFAHVYEFVSTCDNDESLEKDVYFICNIGRQLLESFVSFKVPTSTSSERSVLDNARELDGNSLRVRVALRLLNSGSHSQHQTKFERYDSFSFEETKRTLKDLLCFIYQHDKNHYTCLEAEVLKKEKGAILIPHTELGQIRYEATPLNASPFKDRKKIPLFDLPVSAGTGNFADSDSKTDIYAPDNVDCDFAVNISGDSMTPEYNDGEIALVKHSNESGSIVGKVGIFFYDGGNYCKKLIFENDQYILRSLNAEYDDIQVSIDNFEAQGVVVGKYQNSQEL